MAIQVIKMSLNSVIDMKGPFPKWHCTCNYVGREP